MLKKHIKNKQSYTIHFDNCECQKWVSEPWEVAKLYMGNLGGDKRNVSGPQTTDIAGLLQLMSQCVEFREYCGVDRVNKVCIKLSRLFFVS